MANGGDKPHIDNPFKLLRIWHNEAGASKIKHLADEHGSAKRDCRCNADNELHLKRMRSAGKTAGDRNITCHSKGSCQRKQGWSAKNHNAWLQNNHHPEKPDDNRDYPSLPDLLTQKKR